MRALLYLLILFTSLLHAEPTHVTSKLIIDNESYEHNHESIYGVKNSYVFVVTQHQIEADDNFLFYYGTKVGVVTESYAAENGFGPEVTDYDLLFTTNFGFDFDLNQFEMISLEGSHMQGGLNKNSESQVLFNYQIKF